ncbi:MAG: RNA polymerase sigma factor SigY [Halanaerobiaceae bacterium]
MGEKSEEKQIIENAVTGDRKALEKLLIDNYRIVKGYLLKVTCDYELTEDLTQETMYKAVKNIKNYEPRGKFSTWLVAIASNLYRDHLRKTNRERIMPENVVASISAQNQTANYGDRDKLMQLQKLFSGLTFEKRAVVILKHYYEFTYKEIAEIMQCPVGTVRSRLHYSLNRIRAQIEKGG